jgi:hypothetical protein
MTQMPMLRAKGECACVAQMARAKIRGRGWPSPSQRARHFWAVRTLESHLKWGADKVRQHESSGFFLAFHLLAFHNKLDNDFFCVRPAKTPRLWYGLACCGEPTRAETTWLSHWRRSMFLEAPCGR